ncbi:hypothetical protein FACS1894198_4660 [Clostridia bacterium]|nr:hypothetical protein FACS1894198_4660 [Clostridia bacterium]
MRLQVVLRKQPQKYLAAIDETTRNKLNKALQKLETLTGDIKKLKGTCNHFRVKIHHYRILFTLDKDTKTIEVQQIDARTNIKY